MTNTTGLKALDDLLIHPLRTGTLTIYAGAPASGMTTMLDTAVVAMSIDGDVRAVLCDLETNSWSHWYRLIAATSGVPLAEIQQGASGPSLARTAVAMTKLEKQTVKFSRARTIADLRNDVAEHRAHLVAVDGSRYLDHSVVHRDGHDVTVMNDLKRMAIELNVGVVATVPMPRRPEGTFLGELSGGMHMAADAIVVLRRNKYDEGPSAHVDLTVVKNRNGNIGECTVFGQYTHARFRNIAGPETKAA